MDWNEIQHKVKNKGWKHEIKLKCKGKNNKWVENKGKESKLLENKEKAGKRLNNDQR